MPKNIFKLPALKGLCIAATCFVLIHAEAAAPVFNIVPNANTATVQTDSTTSMSWVVTNNFNTEVSNLNIYPNYETTGQATTEIIANTCTTLSPLGSCTFKTLIHGVHQPSQFQVTPEVCGFNNAVCAQPLGGQALTVRVSDTPRAYAYITTSEIDNVPGSSTLIPIDVSSHESGTALAGFSISGVNRVAVSPDGSRVVFTDAGENFSSVLEVVSGGESPSLLGHLNLPGSSGLCLTVISPDHQWAYIDDIFNSHFFIVNISDPSHPELVNTLELSASPRGIVINSSGTKVYVVDTNHAIEQINTIDGTLSLLSTALTGWPYAITISAGGSELYVTDNSNLGHVEVINTVTGDLISNISVGTDPQGIASSRDGQTVYVTNSGDSTVSVIDTETHLVTHTVSVGCAPNGVSVSPDDSSVFVTCQNSASIPVINTRTNEVDAINLPDGALATFEVGNFVG